MDPSSILDASVGQICTNSGYTFFYVSFWMNYSVAVAGLQN